MGRRLLSTGYEEADLSSLFDRICLELRSRALTIRRTGLFSSRRVSAMGAEPPRPRRETPLRARVRVYRAGEEQPHSPSSRHCPPPESILSVDSTPSGSFAVDSK